jgi:hypothetical protein
MTTQTLQRPAATWRQTKTGEWVVFGPTSLVRPGLVTVAKKSGETKTVSVERIGRSFDAAGIDCCYGYVTARSGRSIPARDSSGISGHVCRGCNAPSYQLSFA